MLERLTQHPYWQWLPAMIVAVVVALVLGWRLRVRVAGLRRTGLLVGYRASAGDGATVWAAIIEWHDEHGVSRTFVDDVARGGQPWPVGTEMALAVAPNKRSVVVLGPVDRS